MIPAEGKKIPKQKKSYFILAKHVGHKKNNWILEGIIY